jgi:alpha-L-rhamnosidase
LPRFSWILEHPGRGQFQKAYQIIVSTDKDVVRKGNGDCWDSGKVRSEENFGVTYCGEKLASSKRYYWTVRWWDGDDGVSHWGDIAFFETGLLEPSDWKAKWISMKDIKTFGSQGSVLLAKNMGEYVNAYTMYLRREFETTSSIFRATAYVCGLGFYELHINGKKVGDRVLDPGQTDYHKVALYATYDVTEFLKKDNAVGVVLGNGRHIKNYGYGFPEVIVQIRVEYRDGTENIFLSDDSWKTSYGPLLQNGLYYGEKYDARLEMPGWDEAGFEDLAWRTAVLVEGPPLQSQMFQPIRLTKTLEPRRMFSPKEGGLYLRLWPKPHWLGPPARPRAEGYRGGA